MDLTLEQLAQYNGKNGQPAYVAVSGIIYDVTTKFINGDHHAIHHAGNDLTDAFIGLHNDDRLSFYPIIGNLITCVASNCDFIVMNK